MAQTIAFLHGLGESPTVWGGVTSAPELASYEYVTPALFTPELITDGWSLDTATEMLATQIGEKPTHLVGLSSARLWHSISRSLPTSGGVTVAFSSASQTTSTAHAGAELADATIARAGGVPARSDQETTTRDYGVLEQP